MYRDFIYYDEDKVKSIIAQLKKGLIESLAEESSHAIEIKGETKTGAVAQLLGIKMGADGKYEYNNASNSNIVLHDYAFNIMTDELGSNLKNISSLERNQILNKENYFVKIKGKLKIYDYKELSSMLSKMIQLSKLFNIRKNEEELKDFVDFISGLYGDLIIIEIINKKGVSFIGLVKQEYLRETMRSLTFKYGSTPSKDWEMIAQITKVPKNSSDDINKKISNFVKAANTNDITQSKSMSVFINNFIVEFNELYDVFASVGYPNIGVEPIGIYRTIGD